VEVLLDDAEVEVEGVESPAAIGRTEAIVVDAVVLDDAVVDVLVEAVDEGVKGTAGVGGASKRINDVKFTTSELKSDAKLALGGVFVSTVLTVSSGSGLGAHCGVAGTTRFGMIDMFRLFGNRSVFEQHLS
jgi:hypothetical protein